MSYAVKEIFHSLQGEGANTGRGAVFCRFAGCNLWTGHEKDRGSAICRFCDTDFVGTAGADGGKFASAAELAAAISARWRAGVDGEGAKSLPPLVIFTGGEPMLQLDAGLIEEMHNSGFEVAVETNGTLPVPDNVDWICVSPKAGATMVQRKGDELKLVFPQPDLPPESVQGLAFTHFFLQPMDGPDLARNTELAVRYCMRHPLWRLSLQTHKFLGIR